MSSQTRADIIIRMQAEQAKREGRDLAKRMAELERELKQADATSKRVDREFSQLAAATARAEAAAGRYDSALAAVNARLGAAQQGSVEYQRALLQQTQITKQADGASDGLMSSLKGLAGATTAAIGGGALISYFNDLRKSGQDARMSVEQSRLQLSVLLGSQERSNRAFEEGQRFAARYAYTQAELASALQASALILQRTNQPADKLLETLGRLGQLNIAEGIDGAAYALRELQSGDITSLVERFNIPRDAARKLRDEIAAGADPVLALDAALNRLGATNELLAARTRGAAGAQNELKLAQEGLGAALDQALGEDALTKFEARLLRGTTVAVQFFDSLGAADNVVQSYGLLLNMTQQLTDAQVELADASGIAAMAQERSAYWAGIVAEQERLATFATADLSAAQRDQALASAQASADAQLLALQQEQVEDRARSTAYALLQNGEAGRIMAAQYKVSGDANLVLAATFYELARAAQTARLAQGIKDVIGDVSKQIRGVTDLVKAQQDYAYSTADTSGQIAILRDQLARLNESDPEYWRKLAQLQGLQGQQAKANAKSNQAAAKAGAKADAAAAREAEQALREQEREAERLAKAKYELLSTTEKLAQRQREYAAATNEADRAELLKDIRDLEKEIADEKERQVDAAISLQQALVKNAQTELDDLKRAEQARKVLNSQTASAEQKARARLALQEIAANAAARKEEIGDLQQAAGVSTPGTGAALDPLRSTMPLVAPASSIDTARYALMRGSTPVAAPALAAGQSGPMRSALGGATPQTQPLVLQMVLDGQVVAEASYPHIEVLLGRSLTGGRDAALAAGTRRP